MVPRECVGGAWGWGGRAAGPCMRGSRGVPACWPGLHRRRTGLRTHQLQSHPQYNGTNRYDAHGLKFSFSFKYLERFGPRLIMSGSGFKLLKNGSAFNLMKKKIISFPIFDKNIFYKKIYLRNALNIYILYICTYLHWHSSLHYHFQLLYIRLKTELM